jgi:osmoprotectant transport system permease protein
LALSLFTGLFLYTGTSLASRFITPSRATVTVGAKTFTEQYVLSEILARRIERSTGLDCDVKQSLGSSILFDALVDGSVDAYVDYTGTIWSTVMKRKEPLESRAELTREVTAFLRERYGIVLVAELGFENGYALAMKKDRAQELGVRRVSDLAPLSSRLSIGGDYEFFARPEYKRIVTTYGREFPTVKTMDASLMYQAAHDGAIDVVSAFSTDGRIAALGLVVLEDDRRAIPPYDAVILAAGQLAKRHPKVIEALRGLGGRLDAEHMRSMNLSVDGEGRSPSAVADAFLDRLAPGAGGARVAP